MRSSSSTSSLDPYYFTAHPPPPPLPTVTPDLKRNQPGQSIVYTNGPNFEPVTPGRDPASIDRNGLVGVGELATPRWTTRQEYMPKAKTWKGKGHGVEEVDENTEDSPKDAVENDVDRSSPWTIEAIDDSDMNEPNSYVCHSSWF